jgi:hypothetical protein
MKPFNALSDFQKHLFFNYSALFFAMVKKRGVRCLYDDSVYCHATVPTWLKRLFSMTEVEKYGKRGCLVRPNSTGRIKLKTRTKESHIL